MILEPSFYKVIETIFYYKKWWLKTECFYNFQG